MVDWSGLTPDLLRLISEQLGVADLIRFGSVCKSWRSISVPPRRGGLLPWLIVPYGDKDYTNGAGVAKAENYCRDGLNLGVFSLYDRKIYRLDLPEVTQTRICGSSATGWLATVRPNFEIKLVHAFTRSQIQLPSLIDFSGVCYPWEIENWSFVREYCMDKLVVTSLDPASSTQPDVVVVIYGHNKKLALFRYSAATTTADKSWNLLVLKNKNTLDHLSSGQFEDVTYYRGRFYAVNDKGWVYMIDGLDSSFPHFALVTKHPELREVKHYLVESLGELLMVSRYIDDFEDEDDDDDEDEDDDNLTPHRTTGFRVYKLDFSGPKLVEIKSLGDRLVFVGYNTSFSVSASETPGCCRSNCIYFTDDFWENFEEETFGGHDLGVFNLDDGTIEPCYPLGSRLIMPSPIWLATNPCDSQVKRISSQPMLWKHGTWFDARAIVFCLAKRFGNHKI